MHHRRDIRVDGSSEEVFVLFAEGEPMCNAGVSILLFFVPKANNCMRAAITR